MKFFNPIIILLLSLIYSFFFEMTFSVNDLLMFAPSIALHSGIHINTAKYIFTTNELGRILGFLLSGRASLRRGKTSSSIYIGVGLDKEEVLGQVAKDLPNIFKHEPIIRGKSCTLLSRSFKSFNSIFIDYDLCKDINYLVSCIIDNCTVDTFIIWIEVGGHHIINGNIELPMLFLSYDNRATLTRYISNGLGYPVLVKGNTMIITQADLAKLNEMQTTII